MKKLMLRALKLLCFLAFPSFTAYAQVNGQCGSANGTAPDSVLTASNDTLCASGAVANFSGSGPWTWWCQGSGGGAPASCSAQANAANTCLPFTMPSRASLLSSPRKVFAFYFGDFFDLSFESAPAASDFYTAYLQTTGFWQPYGGMLRARPLPVSPGPSSLYRMMNFAREVRMALARGITGFAYEIGQTTCPSLNGPGCLQTLNELLAAAQSVDPGFKIMLVPDAGIGADTITSIVQAVYNNPAVYRYNGKVVVAPWWAIGTTGGVNPWVTMKQNLANNNMPIFFMPIDISADDFSAQQAASDGWGYFVTAVPGSDAGVTNYGQPLANLGIQYMPGVTPQHYRPSNYIYWETMERIGTSDSVGLGLISGWQTVINSTLTNMPWVLVTTWNDFSENTVIQPYTDTSLAGSVGTGFYNLNGYFASWFLTQTQPPITHDVLYYFHKKEPVAAVPTVQGAVGAATNTQPASPTQVALPNIAPGVDMIEVVGFLTQPGMIQVSIGGNVSTSNLLPAGLQVFQVPLAAGIPTFSLIRNGQTIFSFQGQTMIYGSSGLPSGYTDMTYWSGGGSANGVCQLSVPPESLTSTIVNSNGACGSATGTSVTAAPTTGLCSLGTASSVIGTGPFTWSCSDPNSNTTALCSANLASQ